MPAKMDYITGVRRAYVGEKAAAQVYGRLAEQRGDAVESAKLAAIARVESRTAAVLEPVAQRLGITCDSREIDDIVQRRLEELGGLSWPRFIAQAIQAWPPYIDEFDALSKDAPATDARAMEWLVAHERALVEFLRIEQMQPGGLASLAPLETLLGTTR
jgi:hypothetical protein